MNRMTAVHRRVICLTSALLILTGLFWAVARYCPQIARLDDEAQALAFAATIMKIHGAAAMAALILLGTLLAKHVPSGWTAPRNKSSGIAMLAVFSILVLTGYLLYYTGGEARRQAVSYLHLAAGLGFTALLAVHLPRPLH